MKMWFLFLLMPFSRADIPTPPPPVPSYAPTELGEPRRPPQRVAIWWWGIPVSVLLLLGSALILQRRDVKERDSDT